MFVVESIEDLWNFIAYVRGYAPNLFPKEDFLSDDDQMTLDRAFELLHQGVNIAYPEASFEKKREELRSILDRSYMAYRNGEDIVAGHLLNEFEGRIFKR